MEYTNRFCEFSESLPIFMKVILVAMALVVGFLLFLFFTGHLSPTTKQVRKVQSMANFARSRLQDTIKEDHKEIKAKPPPPPQVT